MTGQPISTRLGQWLRRTTRRALPLALSSSLLSFSFAAGAAEQILWYPFDDAAGSATVRDASGNGRDGSVVGGVTLDGDAARLDGSSGYIDLPDNLMAGLNAITVTAEVLIEEDQASPYFIYGLGNTNGSNGDGYLFTTGNRYRTAISSCHWSCEQNTDTSSNLPRGTWHHLAYTLANGVGVLYLDGQEVARNEAVTLTPGEIGSGTTLANYLGRSLYSADNYFHGAFGDFQIWNDALSAEAIAFAVPETLLWYPFDDAAGSATVTDASGNGRDGTPLGGVTLNGDIARLDGESGYIDMPDNLLTGLDSISVTAKVRMDSDQRSPYFIYGLGNTSGSYGDGYLFTEGDYYRTALSTCHWTCEQNTGVSGQNLSRDVWHHLAYTLKDGIGILYLDGEEVARNTEVTHTPADIGNGVTVSNYLGRSLYSNDYYFHGAFDDFRIWDGALSASVLSAQAAEALAELTDAEAVAADAAALEVIHADDVRGHLHLAADGENGTTISWTSSDPAVIDASGIVNRAQPGGDTQTVTLTATLTKGEESTVKTFQATVPPLTVLAPFEGYFFTYFTGEGTSNGEQVYAALSNGDNALDWQVLNNGSPILWSTLGEQGARDPFVIRSPEGDRFYLIATDLKINGSSGGWSRAVTWGSRSLLVWESTDLVNWSEARLMEVSPETAGNTWAPEAFWDPEEQAYRVFWASKIYDDATHSNSTYHKMMYALTRDFVHFTEAKVWVDAGYSTIDSTLIEDNGTYYRFTKDERSSSQTPCGKFILAETSTTLSNLNWNFLTDCIGYGDMSQGEGPLVFKENDRQKWYLFIDEFGGRGYIPFETTDLASGQWSPVANYNLPSSPRHGTVLPVTAEEHQRILNAWGN